MATHAAHRWSAGKIHAKEATKSSWNLDAEDCLLHFLATLPNVRFVNAKIVRNPREGLAQVIHLATTAGPGFDQVGEMYWHGTSHLSLPAILGGGLKSSSDSAVHEFTTPGVYVADHRDCSLFYHATAVKMSSCGWADWETPYCRFLLAVQCTGTCKKRSSYGIGQQLVFEEDQVRVTDVYAVRGWSFCDKGERHLSFDVANTILHAPPLRVAYSGGGVLSASAAVGLTADDATLAEWPAYIAEMLEIQTTRVDAVTRFVEDPWALAETITLSFSPELSIDLVEWIPGDRWCWHINLRCASCSVVKVLGDFSKKNQKYCVERRVCVECSY
jgi:hypothetical protein